MHAADRGSAAAARRVRRPFSTALTAQTRLSATVVRWSLDSRAEAVARTWLQGKRNAAHSSRSPSPPTVTPADGRPGTRRSDRGAGRLGRAGRGPDEDTMSLGRGRSRAGVNRQTLRYYERRGAAAEPDRASAGIGSIRPRPSSRSGDQGGSAPGIHPRRGRRIVGRRPPSSSSASALDRGGPRRSGAAEAVRGRGEDQRPSGHRRYFASRDRRGCDDLECAGNACCPIPFASIAENSSPHLSPGAAGRSERDHQRESGRRASRRPCPPRSASRR